MFRQYPAVTTERAIVLADISGYTAYVSGTELDHSHEILGDLLNTLIERTSGSLTVAQIEGDAVFWLGSDVTPELLERLDDAFLAFHRRLRDMAAASVCPCRACASVGGLTLKFVLHRGQLVHQRIGDTDHFVGTDVVIAHRLLKNEVPTRDYVLITGAALDRLLPEVRARFIPHEERYDHLGVLRLGYRDLDELRASAWRVETVVDPATAHLRLTENLSLPPAELWPLVGRVLPAGVADLAWPIHDELGPLRGVATPGPSDGNIPREIHCYHGVEATLSTVLRFIARQQPHLLTLYASGNQAGYYATARLEPEGGGTRLDLAFRWEEPPVPETIERFRAAAQRHLALIRSMLAGDTAAVK